MLASKGLLPEKSVGKWRAPPKDNMLPRASGGEIILFKAFIGRGLALPTSKFFCYLLYFYGLIVNHLTPIGVLHISIFVYLCETFLGICPSINLLMYFFWVKCQPSDMTVHAVGGAGIQLRIETKKEYLEYNLLESVRNWQHEWFYMENHLPTLIKHTGWPPKEGE